MIGRLDWRDTAARLLPPSIMMTLEPNQIDPHVLGSPCAGMIEEFTGLCRKIGLPPVSVSRNCVHAILPDLARGNGNSRQTLTDLAWLVRGAVLGLAPAMRTVHPRGNVLEIQFMCLGDDDHPQMHRLAAMIHTNQQGETRIHLALPHEASALASGRNTILLVEHHPEVAELERLLLEAAGFTVLWTAYANEVMVHIQHEQPAALVLDADLPGINGFEICRQLKSQELTRALPILFCSANVDAPVLAMAAGADRVLRKPGDVPKIATEVGYLLGQTALR